MEPRLFEAEPVEFFLAFVRCPFDPFDPGLDPGLDPGREVEGDGFLLDGFDPFPVVVVVVATEGTSWTSFAFSFKTTPGFVFDSAAASSITDGVARENMTKF